MFGAAAILIGAAFGLRWGFKNNQFDEDIKYVVFDEDDKDKMSPEEFKKSQEVKAKQEEERKKVLKQKAAARQAKHNENR